MSKCKLKVKIKVIVLYVDSALNMDTRVKRKWPLIFFFRFKFGDSGGKVAF